MPFINFLPPPSTITILIFINFSRTCHIYDRWWTASTLIIIKVLRHQAKNSRSQNNLIANNLSRQPFAWSSIIFLAVCVRTNERNFFEDAKWHEVMEVQTKGSTIVPQHPLFLCACESYYLCHPRKMRI